MITVSKKKMIILCAITVMVLIIGLIVFGVRNHRMSEQLTLAHESLTSTKEMLKLETEKGIQLEDQLNTANDVIDAMRDNEYIVGVTVTNKEIEMLAKTVWGEARGCNKMQQSAVVWCILNRVDAGHGSIAEVITKPGQFSGYSKSFPVLDEIRELVEDVVARWKLEKVSCGNVGRTLPKEYIYFSGRNGKNYFRDGYSGDYNTWNWDCWNPYS